MPSVQTIQPAQGKLYTVKDVAAMLGCHANYVYELVASGNLKAVRISRGVSNQPKRRGAIRVSQAAIDAFIEEGGVNPNG